LTSPVVTSLVDANRAIHARLDETYTDVVASLFQSDLTTAKSHLARFVDALHAHLAVEDAHVLPRFAALGPVDDDPHALRKIEGDHVILSRALSSVVEALAAANARDPAWPRAMVAHIDALARLKGVLEHHSLREDRDLYPRLDALLDDVARDLVQRALVGTPPDDTHSARGTA